MKPFVLLVACLAAMSGCAPPAEEPIPAEPSGPADTARQDAAAMSPDGEPLDGEALLETVDDSIRFYVDKLPDRDFTSTYGGEEHPRTWYTAPEALGQIGKPAVPHLIERLDSDDAYEMMLALYGLMLASQDPDVTAETGGEYVRLGEVLTESGNADNRAVALEWWRRHRHVWE